MLIPKCPNCNQTLKTVNEQVAFDAQRNIPIIHQIGICDKCKARFDLQINQNLYQEEENNVPKSKFGTISIIVAIIGLLISILFKFGAVFDIAGIVLAIIGINKKENKRFKHIICIVLCVIGLFFAILNASVEEEINSNSSDSNNADEYVYKEPIIEKEYNTDVVEEISEEDLSEFENVVEESEEEYKASCQTYKYKDVVRNPDNYIGERVKIEIKISSVHEASIMNGTKYYFGNSKDEEYGEYWGDKYGVYDLRDTNDESWFKILDDDVIIVYGEIAGTEQTTSLIVNSEEIFMIEMKYAELISE